ncbi:MAG: flagellar hook-length control protein FliK, partial [Burkholderiaceae bacterium]
ASAAGAAGSAAQSAEAARAERRLEAARASLGSGPLNVEVLKLTRQGGGRAVLEVTPPNQGPIRIDLQLDGAGRASLVVEGLTDSMKARLESSAHFLRQDMASMGLALNLEMRERNDSNGQAQAQAFGQGQFGQSRQQDREAGAGATQASMSGQASGNIPGAGRSTVIDDGIHLVA